MIKISYPTLVSNFSLHPFNFDHACSQSFAKLCHLGWLSNLFLHLLSSRFTKLKPSRFDPPWKRISKHLLKEVKRGKKWSNKWKSETCKTFEKIRSTRLNSYFSKLDISWQFFFFWENINWQIKVSQSIIIFYTKRIRLINVIYHP